jgi:hypothetical protein
MDDEMFYRQVKCMRWLIDVKRVDWRLAQTRREVGIDQIIEDNDKTAGDCQSGSVQGRDRESLNGRRRKRDDGRRPRDTRRAV